MVTQARRLTLSAIVLAVIGVVSACDKVPLLAPTGTVITVLPASTVIPAFGETEIIATVIEQGTVTTPGTGTGTGGGTGTGTSTRGAGTPVQNGTLISFTTTLGRIEPREARTQNGEVRVKLITNGESGTAVVTAFSGGASGKTEALPVGSAAAGRIVVTATPQTLGSNGGSTQVSAIVTDANGRALAGIPVTFTSDRGTLSQSVVNTDANGVATTTLQTTGQTTVTARAGAQSATFQVNVNARALSGFTVSNSTPSTGTPVTFTVTPAANAVIQNVTIDFGDGDRRNLGAISGPVTVAKTYNTPGQFTATATAVDVTGEQQTLTTVLSVGSLAIGLSGPLTVQRNAPATYTVSGTESAQVREYQWTTSDGQSITTTSRTWTTSFPGVGNVTVRVAVIGVNGATIGNAETRTSVTP